MKNPKMIPKSQDLMKGI